MDYFDKPTLNEPIEAAENRRRIANLSRDVENEFESTRIKIEMFENETRNLQIDCR